MTVSAADAAREIRRRLPGIGLKKLHKLLYLAQGHHLAHAGAPLFAETLSAWDHGPVVGRLWHQESQGTDAPSPRELDEGRLNTIGYVISRYGRLSGRDLEDLAHAQRPWRDANRDRPAGESVRIDNQAIEDFFRQAQDDSDDQVPLDRDVVREWLATSAHDVVPSGRFDSVEEIRRRMLDAG